MPKSNTHREARYLGRQIFRFKGDEDRPAAEVERFDINGMDAPPYHVGKVFPYVNARRALEENVDPENRHLIGLPHPKEPEQVEREMAYLGRNRHQLAKRPSRRKFRRGLFALVGGGDGTIRRSSRRKAHRGLPVVFSDADIILD